MFLTPLQLLGCIKPHFVYLAQPVPRPADLSEGWISRSGSKASQDSTELLCGLTYNP